MRQLSPSWPASSPAPSLLVDLPPKRSPGTAELSSGTTLLALGALVAAPPPVALRLGAGAGAAPPTDTPASDCLVRRGLPAATPALRPAAAAAPAAAGDFAAARAVSVPSVSTALLLDNRRSRAPPAAAADPAPAVPVFLLAGPAGTGGLFALLAAPACATLAAGRSAAAVLVVAADSSSTHSASASEGCVSDGSSGSMPPMLLVALTLRCVAQPAPGALLLLAAASVEASLAGTPPDSPAA